MPIDIDAQYIDASFCGGMLHDVVAQNVPNILRLLGIQGGALIADKSHYPISVVMLCSRKDGARRQRQFWRDRRKHVDMIACQNAAHDMHAHLVACLPDCRPSAPVAQI